MSSSRSQELALLDEASRLLAEANTLEEIKSFHDKVAGVHSYIKAAKLGLTLLNQAAEAKLRAERRAGIALRSMHLRGGNRKSKGARCPLNLKLEDLGISRHESKRWQRLAAVPEGEFCEYFRIANELGVEATLTGLLRLAADTKACHRSHNMKNPHCQDGAALCEGSSEMETERALGLAELANHFGLNSNVLMPICDNPDREFKSGQRRIVGRYLKDMSAMFSQLNVHSAANPHY